MTLNPTITPFSFDVLSAMSLGDPRGCAMACGPWELLFHEDVICLDGEPVTLHSWEHARGLVAGRPDALRWLEILQEDTEHRARLERYGG